MDKKAWKINEAGIIKSMEAVIKSRDIKKLTKDCYNFTSNLSGFIAHYNLYGFMCQYENTADLIRDLKNSTDLEQPEYYLDQCFLEEQPDYYQAKVRILKAFKKLVDQYN